MRCQTRGYSREHKCMFPPLVQWVAAKQQMHGASQTGWRLSWGLKTAGCRLQPGIRVTLCSQQCLLTHLVLRLPRHAGLEHDDGVQGGQIGAPHPS